MIMSSRKTGGQNGLTGRSTMWRQMDGKALAGAVKSSKQCDTSCHCAGRRPDLRCTTDALLYQQSSLTRISWYTMGFTVEENNLL